MSSSSQSWFHRFMLSLWYGHNPLAYLLLPWSWLFRLLAKRRRQRLQSQVADLNVPIIVVGNISVGGTGKTPVVIALANALIQRGIRVGIISRGYGSESDAYPLDVLPATPVEQSGDESLLIARSVNCPVVIDPLRVKATQHLLAKHPQTQVIISDDGLQHYALSRSMEIVVVDAKRGLGNGMCLPAGPLREPASRLSSVDHVLLNGDDLHTSIQNQLSQISTPYTSIQLRPIGWQHVKTGEMFPLMPLPWLPGADPIKAIAAIGNPERFFNTINNLNIKCQAVSYDDHHAFSPQDAANWKDHIVLMTSKDAVKCQAFAKDQWWSLDVAVTISESLIDDVLACIDNAARH